MVVVVSVVGLVVVSGFIDFIARGGRTCPRQQMTSLESSHVNVVLIITSGRSPMRAQDEVQSSFDMQEHAIILGFLGETFSFTGDSGLKMFVIVGFAISLVEFWGNTLLLTLVEQSISFLLLIGLEHPLGCLEDLSTTELVGGWTVSLVAKSADDDSVVVLLTGSVG